MENMTPEQYRSKKEEVIGKFKQTFVEQHLYTDSTFNTVLEMLIRDASPYDMIEALLNARVEDVRKMEEYVMFHATPRIIKK